MANPALLSLPDQPVAGSAAVSAWLQAWRLCLLLGAFGVLPLVVLTPPFQVPDEQQHFFRAYQLSEGRILSTAHDGKAGAVLPSSLPQLAESYLGSRDLHRRRVVPTQPLQKELAAALDQPIDDSRREFVDFTGAAYASPLPYLPQAAAIGAGRHFGASPLALLYLGRLANATVTLLLLAWALRLMPLGQRAALLAALLPMAAYLYASLSPDSLVIATAFLFTALMLRGCLSGRWSSGEVGVAVIAALVFCSLKPVYAPMLLLGLPAALRRESRRHALVVNGCIATVALAGSLLWLRYAPAGPIAPRAGTGVADQLALVTAHPLGFARVVYWTLLNAGLDYYQQVVGVFGWLSVKLPVVAYALPLAGLLFALPASRHTPALPLPVVAWYVALVGASAMLVLSALYLFWSPVGGTHIEGLQGRYFIPLLAPLAAVFGSLAVVRTSTAVADRTMAGLALVIAASLFATQVTVVTAFSRLQ